MKFIILSLITFLSANSIAAPQKPVSITTKGELSYDATKGIAPKINPGYLIINGEAAVALYDDMTDRNVQTAFSCKDESGVSCLWPELEGKKGKHIDCRKNRVTEEITCIISIADFTKGEIRATR